MLTLGEGYNALRAMRMGRHGRFCAIRIGDGGATDRSSHLHHIEIALAVFTSCGECQRRVDRRYLGSARRRATGVGADERHKRPEQCGPG